MIRNFLICTLLLALGLACGACSKDGNEGPVQGGSGSGDGKALLEATLIGENKAPGCLTCHSLDPDKNLVGPSLAGIGIIAESAVEGMSANEYLLISIVEPDAHITEGFPAGVMYQNYGKDLSDADIRALVNYLLSLK